MKTPFAISLRSVEVSPASLSGWVLATAFMYTIFTLLLSTRSVSPTDFHPSSGHNTWFNVDNRARKLSSLPFFQFDDLSEALVVGLVAGFEDAGLGFGFGAITSAHLRLASKICLEKPPFSSSKLYVSRASLNRSKCSKASAFLATSLIQNDLTGLSSRTNSCETVFVWEIPLSAAASKALVKSPFVKYSEPFSLRDWNSDGAGADDNGLDAVWKRSIPGLEDAGGTDESGSSKSSNIGAGEDAAGVAGDCDELATDGVRVTGREACSCDLDFWMRSCSNRFTRSISSSSE
ncbi:hypothetical protein OGAPHI_005978 [Ogataea philodendri]|uniref:Uncharacterized protein n=1 Tax=Ogataea philodendri TaxID=1378263 RepID=A0A9P8NXX0_9ASCO|nr:uncharacterized protein OGAPHI_005978 [Ogataea philodendri]KAH3661800.1 hypothetical protein OGAPHI_005978 [Ogataea philodendri]